ncbi:MAG: hypothetical protein EKK39_14325 [Sphingobacteriales bacterium]|uniref:hypothetical protein n=1 Tax=Hydrotalea flava TaxID=714549 RepID=UPI0008305D07|nr:hypothetical protein [Hydrotalea flava]RTL47441.1 MAG: hypothetical protein EKK39_14325 [Sphingobacteriales bacterium]
MKNSIRLFRLVLLLFLFATLVSTGCKKNLNSSISTTGTDGIQPFPLSWETADYMPTPTGTSILVPWANGSVKGFSPDIWYDYKSSDGWTLVYNVFNTTSLPANPWFALYNKYRGLLRIYVYVTNNGFVASDYLTSGLNLAPNSISSSMLNYIGQDVVDVTKNQTSISKIEPTQLATGTWYASQYEIAYDPNIVTSTYQQLGLNWTLKWTSVSSIALGGTQQGTINGTISTPAPSFDISGLLTQGALEATGLAIFSNNAGGDKTNYTQNTLGLPGNIFKSIQDGLQSGLSGVVKNIFNGIFGGSSSNTQEVNLTMNTKIQLTGTSSQSGAFIPDPGLGIGIPGISNSQSASGYIPGYNQPMGVFSLSSTPIINKHTTTSIVYVNEGGVNVPSTKYTNLYTVNSNIFNSAFITNPNVINSLSDGAIIKNLQTQVVILNPNTAYNFQAFGNNETVGSYNVYTGTSVTTNYTLEHGSQPSNQAAVRVIFDVVPNNGAPKSTIIKTFLANIVNN